MSGLQRFLRRREVEDLVGLKHSQLYELIRAGRFPAPVRISKGPVRWPESLVVEWQQRLIGQSTSNEPRNGRL